MDMSGFYLCIVTNLNLGLNKPVLGLMADCGCKTFVLCLEQMHTVIYTVAEQMDDKTINKQQ